MFLKRKQGSKIKKTAEGTFELNWNWISPKASGVTLHPAVQFGELRQYGRKNYKSKWMTV